MAATSWRRWLRAVRRSPVWVWRWIRQLTRRQTTALVGVSALGVSAALAAFLGWVELTLTLLAAMAVALFGSQVQLRRRLRGENTGVSEEVRRLAVINRRLASDLRRMQDQHHQLGAQVTALRSEVADLGERLDFGHRRVVSALERERLAAADRYALMLSIVGEAPPRRSAVGERADRPARATRHPHAGEPAD